MPRPLRELLERKQAIEVIPGVLYFTSVSERLHDIEAELNNSPTPQEDTCNVNSAMKAPNFGDFAFAAPPSLHSESVPSAAIQGANVIGEDLQVKIPHGFRGSVANNAAFQRRLRERLGEGGGCYGVLEDDAFYFTLGNGPRFQYQPFFADFGPLGLDCVTALSRYLKSLLELCASFRSDDSDSNQEMKASQNNVFDFVHFNTNESLSGGLLWGGISEHVIPVVFCSGLGNHERANAACLLACFCVAGLRWSAAETWRIFQEAFPPIISFRDASYGVSTFPLSLSDILGGLQRAVELGWYDPNTFDLQEYDRLRIYDCCWIIPKALLTFSSPVSGDPNRDPVMYAKLFQELRVAGVVRLNEPLYDRHAFLSRGIQHEDLEFPDGTAPNDAIINRFMEVVDPILSVQPPATHSDARKRATKERETSDSVDLHPKGREDVRFRGRLKSDSRGGAVAVHCHAGLGRTGTIACTYIIRRYGFTARGAVGWTRLCRPGSVMGAQHMFLEKFERRLLRPVKSLDFLHAQRHLRVVGSGVVSHLSAYSYQTHKLRHTSSMNESVTSLSLSLSGLSGHSTRSPSGQCEPLSLATPAPSANMNRVKRPSRVVIRGRSSQCSTSQGSHVNNNRRSPVAEALRANPIAALRTLVTNSGRSHNSTDLDREEVRRLPDGGCGDSLGTTTVSGVPLHSSLQSRRPRGRTSCVTPPRVQALVNESRRHLNARLSVLSVGNEGKGTSPDERYDLAPEVKCCLPTAVGPKGENLLAVNATALGFFAATGCTNGGANPFTPRVCHTSPREARALPSAQFQKGAADPGWGGRVVFLQP
ncbi:tyrosine phosphatase, putative [Trypanosoma brucei brucei TREU927]|uniref:Tyrosine phosphatase, putative n=1 Tax=Trypanosoma brucei brucei (strain 927/4 GUTat10.1) TaxID=185431 RepID=Q382T8_TRYB2|nr:tyrosine phosphatase, putative [Trypanosoma brucei brucei TREU927]EAN80193.1 tyrosine phosphatase, putative [Trypanosoma brucei brucei TREU927]